MLDKLNIEHKQYLIGFLQGDGSLSKLVKNKGKLSVELSARDEQIIDWIKSLNQECNYRKFNRIRNTNFKNDFSSVGFEICLKTTRDKFRKYIPNGIKSATIKPPDDLIQDNINHYLRGFLDADGAIGITKLKIPFVSFTTSSEFMKDFIIDDVKRYIGFEMRINRNERDNIYNITLFRENAVEYSKRLYKNATIFLNRKYDKYLEVQRQVRTTPKRCGVTKRQLEYEDSIVLLNELNIEDKIKLLNRTMKSINARRWRLTKSSNK